MKSAVKIFTLSTEMELPLGISIVVPFIARTKYLTDINKCLTT